MRVVANPMHAYLQPLLASQVCAPATECKPAEVCQPATGFCMRPETPDGAPPLSKKCQKAWAAAGGPAAGAAGVSAAADTISLRLISPTGALSPTTKAGRLQAKVNTAAW